MPTYDYRCESCGRTFEVVQSFSDAPLSTCEECGGALRKVYAPVGIVFKGSGFYKTDSRSSSSSTRTASKPASTESTTASDSSTSSGTKSSDASGTSSSASSPSTKSSTD